MAKLMIRCPVTGKDIFTGIAMDERSFESAEIGDNYVKCPECGQQHRWSKDDAFVGAPQPPN